MNRDMTFCTQAACNKTKTCQRCITGVEGTVSMMKVTDWERCNHYIARPLPNFVKCSRLDCPNACQRKSKNGIHFIDNADWLPYDMTYCPYYIGE